MSVQIEGVDDLEASVRERAQAKAQTIAARWQQYVLRELQDADEGADGLMDYVTPVEETDDGASFTIDHPAAVLHEYGGNSRVVEEHALLRGDDRSEFYEALSASGQVTRKNIVRKAKMRVRNEW